MKDRFTKTELVKRLEGFDLRSDLTRKDIARGCKTVKKFGFRGVAAHPYRVAYFSELLKGSGIKIIGAVGFPSGATLSEVKALETSLCIKNGADEIDMVINIGALKDGDYKIVRKDMEAVVSAAKGRPVKAILNSPLLTDEEKVRACELAKAAGISYIKTSGGEGGEVPDSDVELIRRTVGHALRIKASFAYKLPGYDLDDILRFFDAGADIIGVKVESDGPTIIEGFDRWKKWLK